MDSECENAKIRVRFADDFQGLYRQSERRAVSRYIGISLIWRCVQYNGERDSDSSLAIRLWRKTVDVAGNEVEECPEKPMCGYASQRAYPQPTIHP